LRNVSLYLLAFVATWLWGSINRIFTFQHGGDVYGLWVMHAFFTPLQGFLNFLVYFWTTIWKRSALKEAMGETSSIRLADPETPTTYQSYGYGAYETSKPPTWKRASLYNLDRNLDNHDKNLDNHEQLSNTHN